MILKVINIIFFLFLEVFCIAPSSVIEDDVDTYFNRRAEAYKSTEDGFSKYSSGQSAEEMLYQLRMKMKRDSRECLLLSESLGKIKKEASQLRRYISRRPRGLRRGDLTTTLPELPRSKVNEITLLDEYCIIDNDNPLYSFMVEDDEITASAPAKMHVDTEFEEDFGFHGLMQRNVRRRKNKVIKRPKKIKYVEEGLMYDRNEDDPIVDLSAELARKREEAVRRRGLLNKRMLMNA